MNDGILRLFIHNVDHILVPHHMPQTHSLRDVSGAGTPDERVFEALLEFSVDVVTDVLDTRSTPDDQRF